MAITFRNRPFIVKGEEAFKKGEWNEQGEFNYPVTLDFIAQYNWAGEIDRMKEAIIHNRSLMIYDMMPPSFNLLNEDNQTELFVCSYDHGLYDLHLISPNDSSLEVNVSSVNESALLTLLDLFYKGNLTVYNEEARKQVEQASPLKASLSKNLVQVSKARRKGVVRNIILLLLAIASFLLYKYGLSG